MTLLENIILWNSVAAVALAVAIKLVSRFPSLKVRPSLTRNLWILVLLKLITPPLWSVPVLPSFVATADSDAKSPRATSTTRVSRTGRPSPSAVEPFNLGEQAALLLFVISGLGTTVIVGRCLADIRRIRAILRYGLPPRADVSELLSQLAESAGLKSAPRVSMIDAAVSPFLWVDWRGATILLPQALVQKLTTDELACVINHELAHYLRRDHWMNFLTFGITTLCWWNPLAWWARREIHTAQELCCDAHVIRGMSDGAPQTRRCYAEALLKAVDSLHAADAPLPMLATSFGGAGSMQGRIEMIANRQTSHRLPWWAWPVLLLCGGFLPCLPVCSAKDGKAATAVKKGAEAKEDSDDKKSGNGKKAAKEEEEDDEDELKVKDLPKAVQKTLKREAAGGEIGEIEKEVEDGKTIFEIKVEFDQEDEDDDDEDEEDLVYEIKISKDGTLLSKILLSDEEEDEDEQ